MIDYVTAKCYEHRITRHLTPEYLKNMWAVERIINYDFDFMLYNFMNRTSSYLRIICPHTDSEGYYVPLTIKGSLRKWWYGDKSVADFSKQDYEAAILFLFDNLKISPEEMRYFILSKIEVGMNIFLKVACAEMLNGVIGYKSRCYKRNSYGVTGIVYETKTYKNFIKLYDKVEEICKDFKNSRVTDVEELQFLENYLDKNILRIERTLLHPAKIKKELGFHNLEDSIMYFGNLYSYFWKQIQPIQFINDCDRLSSMDGLSNISYKELVNRLTCERINDLGIERFDRMTKQLKRNVRRKIKKLYQSISIKSCSYNKRAFENDVINQMLHSMVKSRCFVKKLFLRTSAA